MIAELRDVRSQLTAALACIDRLLAGTPTAQDIPTARWRVSPGGPLSREGIEEVYRRFAEGEADPVVARALGISVQGVRKRRTSWNATHRVRTA